MKPYSNHPSLTAYFAARDTLLAELKRYRAMHASASCDATRHYATRMIAAITRALETPAVIDA
jgi:hypothetical protein